MTALLVSLFQHKAWCNRGLAAALRAAPAEADRRQMAVALLTFEHTWIVDRIFKARLVGEDAGLTSVVGARVSDLEALSRAMGETDAWYEAYATRVTPAELEEALEFTYVDDGQPGRMTRGDMLAHVITHGASHRGAVGKMLEGMGVKGAPDSITTFNTRGRPAA
jgi:uncharacterized damage-inducible protein DinB